MKVCIYCASSKNVPSIYFEKTKVLTEQLVAGDLEIVYGGGSRGLMGQVADTCLELNGKIKGVIPGFMIEVEWDHKGVKDMEVVKDMNERKQRFFEASEALIALPGGVGTLEELSEAMSLKRLGLIQHPIIIANFDGFYSEFLIYLNKMVDQEFMGETGRELWTVIETPEEINSALAQNKPWPKGLVKSESY